MGDGRGRMNPSSRSQKNSAPPKWAEKDETMLELMRSLPKHFTVSQAGSDWNRPFPRFMDRVKIQCAQGEQTAFVVEILSPCGEPIAMLEGRYDCERQGLVGRHDTYGDFYITTEGENSLRCRLWGKLIEDKFTGDSQAAEWVADEDDTTD